MPVFTGFYSTLSKKIFLTYYVTLSFFWGGGRFDIELSSSGGGPGRSFQFRRFHAFSRSHLTWSLNRTYRQVYSTLVRYEGKENIQFRSISILLHTPTP